MGISVLLNFLKRIFVRLMSIALTKYFQCSAQPNLRPGITVLTVNWNAKPYLCVMLEAIRRLSPTDVDIIVIDNHSTDGSWEYLKTRSDITAKRMPLNVGHGPALDVGVTLVETEYLAILDIDAFPISPLWLEKSIAALKAGAQIAGAHMHRNFIHPCFLVTRTKMLREFKMTFRPVGSIRHLEKKAPLFLDVGEALSQRVIIRFGGSRALFPFEISSSQPGGVNGAVFGEIVYHNMFATQGVGKTSAPDLWRSAVERFHPHLLPLIKD